MGSSPSAVRRKITRLQRARRTHFWEKIQAAMIAAGYLLPVTEQQVAAEEERQRVAKDNPPLPESLRDPQKIWDRLE